MNKRIGMIGSIINVITVLAFAIFNSEEILKEFITKLPQSVKEGSNLNIKNINESDNAVEVLYFNKAEVLYFDEKPEELKNIKIDE